MVVAAAICIFKRTPMLIQTHGMCSPWLGIGRHFDQFVTWPILRKARVVYVLHDDEKKSIETAAKVSNCQVLFNALSIVDDEIDSHGRGRPARQIRLLYCSRLHPRKRVDRFIDICSHIANLGQLEVKATIIGPDEGSGEEARRRAAESECTFRFTGALPSPDVYDEMLMSDVFVHTAPEEPFGMAIVESLSLRLPAVIDKSVRLEPILSEHNAAWLVDTGDIRAAADAVLDAYARNDQTRNRIQNGRNLVESMFSIEALSRALHDMAYDVFQQS